MQEFITSKNAFKQVRNATLIKSVPLLLLAGTTGIVINHFNPNNKPSDVNVLPIIIPVMLGVLGIGLYRGLNRQKKIFESYRLILNDVGITRVQKSTPTISIFKSDICSIIKNRNGSFTIKGKSNVDTIFVPYQVENYEKLENELSALREITIKSKEPVLQKFRGIVSILAIGLMIAVYLSKDKILVGISGTLLLGFFAYSFFQIKGSKNVDNKTKRGMWWLLLVSVSIIGIMYMKLSTVE